MAAITEYIEIILAGKDLTFDQAQTLLDTIFNGDIPEVQVAAFLTAMRAKGPVPTELAGLASSLKAHAVKVNVDPDSVIDTCGTGGATVKTFNISTAAALVAAGARARVAKHGNRAITSNCGSADVLTALGVKVDAAPETITNCINQANIGFMFAPMFHPAMKYVQPVRKGLGFRTVFNILGPLANPAGAKAQVMGVAAEELLDMIVETLKLLGTKRAMVVHSDGLDEISTFGITKIRQLTDGKITTLELNPADLGIAPATLDQLKGSDAQTNAKIVRDILTGKETGQKKDIVILNAAAAIIVADLADDFTSAIKIADDAINTGKAAEALEKLIKISNE
ncbi:anthranilate phosphoribosyltransferase [Planctomycetota bacterium]